MKNKIILSLLLALGCLGNTTMAMQKKRQSKKVTQKSKASKKIELNQLSKLELEAIVTLLEPTIEIMADYSEVDKHLKSLDVTRTKLYNTVAKLQIDDSLLRISSYLETIDVNIHSLFSLFDEYLIEVREAQHQIVAYETMDDDESDINYLASYFIIEKELQGKIGEFCSKVDALKAGGKSFINKYKELSDLISKYATKDAQEVYTEYKGKIEEASEDIKINIFSTNPQVIFDYLVVDINNQTKSKLQSIYSWHNIIVKFLEAKKNEFLSLSHDDLDDNYTNVIKEYKNAAKEMLKKNEDKIKDVYDQCAVQLITLDTELE